MAREVLIKELPHQNILPESRINCFFQDHFGNIWYGSENGLFKDDGFNIQIFRSDFNNSYPLSSNNITCITENKNGDIIFGTLRGAYILKQSDNTIHHIYNDFIDRSVIKNITITSDNNIWIATESNFIRFNSDAEFVKNYSMMWGDGSRQVNALLEDHYGQIWLMLWKGGILKYDEDNDKFTPYHWPFESSPSCFLKDEDDKNYWIGTWKDGIVKFNPNPQLASEDKRFSLVLSDSFSKDKPSKIMYIVSDSIMKYLWVITNNNLIVYSKDDKGLLTKIDISELSDFQYRRINNMICDNNGNLWIADKYNNSYIITFPDLISTYYSDEEIKKNLGFSFTPSHISSDSSYFWFRQRQLGLFLLNKKTGNLTSSRNKRLSSTFIPKNDDRGIYTMMNNTELMLIQNEGDRIIEKKLASIPLDVNERVRTIYESNDGIFWLGTNHNLYRYNINIGTIRDLFVGPMIITKIVSSDNGDIFVSTEQNGVFRINTESEINKIAENENCISLHCDKSGRIWLGSISGNLFCYDKNKLTKLTSDLNLNGDAILEITSDADNNIWILTRYNLYIYDYDNERYRILSVKHDFSQLEYFTTLSRSSDNTITLAGAGGIYRISTPYSFPTLNDQLTLSTVRVNNKNIFNFGDTIFLNPNEINIELYFSSFDFLNSDNTRFSFRLNNDTVKTYLKQGDNHIYLSSLNKGIYNVEVTLSGNGSRKSDMMKNIIIIKKPYWWETITAIISYFIIMILIIGVIIKKYLNYHTTLQKMKADIHISEMKSKFLTNISHEFRTPLSLISMPLEKMIKETEDEGVKQQLIAMNKNTSNLLSLVNELLDLKNIVTDNEILIPGKTDIISLVNSVCHDFKPLANTKNINIEYPENEGQLFVFVDSNKITKSLNNLISNAIKFTPQNGAITVSVRIAKDKNPNKLLISVKDNGIGISENEKEKIFDRFYRAEKNNNQPGNGIGLHIVKEYISLHRGDISVFSENGRGSEFIISIPITEPINENITLTSLTNIKEDIRLDTSSAKKTILLIEDNTEFRDYMRSELSLIYDVYDTDTGETGVELAREMNPDVIISDVMLPGISGIEVCCIVKNDIAISHIPVILMTADCSIATMAKGYKEGADHYITKPFVFDILLSNIRNLMIQNNNRHRNFADEQIISPEKLTISLRDEKFIEKVIELIEANMSNS